MRNKLYIILFIILLGATASYVLSGSILIYILTLLLIGGILLYFTKRNNKHRKENLNIIQDESKLYFYLSDDLLFSVDLGRDKNITETLRSSIQNEMSTIHNITRKICFINFKDDLLLKELNKKLNMHNKK